MSVVAFPCFDTILLWSRFEKSHVIAWFAIETHVAARTASLAWILVSPTTFHVSWTSPSHQLQSFEWFSAVLLSSYNFILISYSKPSITSQSFLQHFFKSAAANHRNDLSDATKDLDSRVANHIISRSLSNNKPSSSPFIQFSDFCFLKRMCYTSPMALRPFIASHSSLS